jgi:hypothetical protein
MMSVEEHQAVLHDLMRHDHEEYVAQVRAWAETAEAEGRVAAARQHQQHVARLEAMSKPWETASSQYYAALRPGEALHRVAAALHPALLRVVVASRIVHRLTDSVHGVQRRGRLSGSYKGRPNLAMLLHRTTRVRSKMKYEQVTTDPSVWTVAGTDPNQRLSNPDSRRTPR